MVRNMLEPFKVLIPQCVSLPSLSSKFFVNLVFFFFNNCYPLLHTVPIKTFACKCFWQTPLGSGHSSGWVPGKKKHAFWACLPWSHWADQPRITLSRWGLFCSLWYQLCYWERELFLSGLLLSWTTGDGTKMPQRSVFLLRFSPFCWFSASQVATSFWFVSSVPKKCLILTVFARVLVASIEGWSSAVSYSDHYIDIILPIFSYRNLGLYSCILRSSLYVWDINTLWLVVNCFALVHHLVCCFVHGAATYSNIFHYYQIY